MTIIKSVPTQNFTQIDNSLLNSAMPAQAKNVLLYLLSKPKDWQPKAHDIRKQLGLSAYATKKALRWLCQAGYAAYDRLKSGHTVWRIFSNPETAHSPAISPQVENPQVENRPVLQIIETEQILKQQPSTPVQPTVESENVVVNLSVNEETAPLIFPATLDKDQKKAIKAIAKQLDKPEMTQELLFTLAYAIASGHIKSSLPGYFRRLVDAANNGTFTAVQAHTATKSPTAADRAEETQKRLSEAKNVKVDNASFFEDLKNRFGAKAAAAIPS